MNRGNWDGFCQQNNGVLHELANRPIPRPNTLLARNLSYILEKLRDGNRPIHDVVLYFQQGTLDGWPQRIVDQNGQSINNPLFHLVKIRYQTLGQSGYFQISQ
jgi:hypothetical protein